MAHGLLFSPGMSDLLNVSPFQRSLDYHAERHNVIASNIANANTPAFRPMELLRVEDDELLKGSLPMKRTEATHLLGSNVPALHQLEVVDDDSSLGGLDGNTVSVEREMSKLQANDLRYQGAVKLVSRQLAVLRYAANDGSSAG